jgi:hypothetical protein
VVDAGRCLDGARRRRADDVASDLVERRLHADELPADAGGDS